MSRLNKKTILKMYKGLVSRLIILIFIFNSATTYADVNIATALNYLLRRDGKTELSDEDIKRNKIVNLRSDILRHCIGLGRQNIGKVFEDILPNSLIKSEVSEEDCSLKLEYDTNSFLIETVSDGIFLESVRVEKTSNHIDKKIICDRAKNIVKYSLEGRSQCSSFFDIKFNITRY